MTDFHEIEQRCFALDDMMQVGDSLLAAMVADEHVSQAWETNAFVGMYFDECQEAMRVMWEAAKAESLVYLNRRFWRLNIEGNATNVQATRN